MATTPRPRRSFCWTWFHSLSMVAPPSEKIASVWLSGRPSAVRSTNVSSRVFFTSSAARSSARSRSHTSHSVAPGARWRTRVARLGLTWSWYVAAPLGQRVPSLTRLLGSPSMFTIVPSTVWTSVPQPTAQYGHTLGTALASLMRSAWARATAGLRSTPRPARPPTAVPAAALADNRKKSRRVTSMALSSAPRRPGLRPARPSRPDPPAGSYHDAPPAWREPPRALFPGHVVTRPRGQVPMRERSRSGGAVDDQAGGTGSASRAWPQ